MSDENAETIARLYDEFLAKPERLASSEQFAYFDPAVELHQSESLLGSLDAIPALRVALS